MTSHRAWLFFRFLWCSLVALGLSGCATPYSYVQGGGFFQGGGFLPSYDEFLFGTVPEKERIAISSEKHAELSSMVIQTCRVARAERADQQYIGQDRPSRTIVTSRLSPSYEARVRELLSLARIPEPVPAQEASAEETPLRTIEHPAVQGGAGLASGVTIGFVPGGAIGADLAIRAELLPEGTRSARIGKASGELIAGVTQIVVGCGGMGTGIGMSGTGGGAIVGVPVFVGSFGLTLDGVATSAVGAQHLLVEIWRPKADTPAASTSSPETTTPPTAKPPPQETPAAKPPQQEPPAAPAELKPYKEGAGHHVPAKKAFEGKSGYTPGYDPKKALAIPNAVLDKMKVKHAIVTGAQRKRYKEFAETGQPLTWEAVAKIETQALIDAKMSVDVAQATVAKAIQALKDAGVAAPVRIPWGN